MTSQTLPVSGTMPQSEHLVHNTQHTDQIAGDNVDTTIWSEIEIFTAAICACLPAVRQLLQRAFPKILGSRDESSGKTEDSTPKHSNGKFVSQEVSKMTEGSQDSHPTPRRSVLGTGRGASGRRLSEGSDTVELVEV